MVYIKPLLDSLTRKEKGEVLTMLASLQGLRVVSAFAPIGGVEVSQKPRSNTIVKGQGRMKGDSRPAPSAAWRLDYEISQCQGRRSELVALIKVEQDPDRKRHLLDEVHEIEQRVKRRKLSFRNQENHQ
jgi:hypothetical protein